MGKQLVINVSTVLMTLVLSIGIVSCGNLKPEEVVDKTIASEQTDDYKKIVNQLYLDSLTSLSDKEIEIFVNTLSELRKDNPKISTYELLSYPKNDAKSGDFMVKLTFEDGVNETQIGRLIKNSEGQWKIDVLSDSIPNDQENCIVFGNDIRIALLKVLASRSIAQRQYELGMLYLESSILPHDTIQAVRLIKAASDSKYAPAMGRYGNFLLTGENGVAKNEEEGFQLVKLAADENEPYSIGVISGCYSNGIGVELDYNKSFEYASKGAALKEPESLCILGWLYDHGKGVEKDDVKAVECFRTAATMNHAGGIRNLGVMTKFGKGIPQNLKEAFRLFKKAADMGDAKACLRLGVCYAQGEGTPKDYSEAYKWLKKAVDLGNHDAIEWLRWVEHQ